MSILRTALRLGPTAALLAALACAAPLAGQQPGEAAPDARDEAYGHYGAANMAILEALRLQERGDERAALQAWRTAADQLEKASEKDPQSEEILRTLLTCYLQLGQTEPAARTLSRLGRLGPRGPEQHRDLARVYESIHKTDLAVAELEKGLEKTEPGSPEWRALTQELAAVLRAAGRPEKAAALYRALRAHAPDDREAALAEGYCLGEAGRHDEAIALLQPFLKAPGDLPEGERVRLTYFVANAYRRADKADEGAGFFAELAARRPDDGEVHQSLLHLLDAAGKPDEAVRAGQAFLEKHPRADAVALLLADLHARRGRPEDALALFLGVLERNRALRDLTAQQILGLVDRSGPGSSDAALKALQKVLDTEGLSEAVRLDARVRLALLHRRAGRADKALDALGPLAESGPGAHWRVRLLYGHLLAEAGRAREAVALFEKAIPQHAGDPQALFALHYALGSLSLTGDAADPARAEKHLRIALDLSPDDPGAANSLGYFYALQGRNLDEAERLLKRSLKARPEEPAFLDSLGWIYYRMALRDDSAARLDDALRHLRLAVEKAKDPARPDAPADPVVLDHLGDALFVAGHWEEAAEHWRRALGAPQEPGGEPLDRAAAEAKIARVKRLLTDEARERGGPQKPAQRRERPLRPPMPADAAPPQP